MGIKIIVEEIWRGSAGWIPAVKAGDGSVLIRQYRVSGIRADFYAAASFHLVLCFLFLTSLVVPLSAVETAAALESAAKIRADLVQFDGWLKSGVRKRKLGPANAASVEGTDLFKARAFVDRAWELARAAKLQTADPDLFQKVATDYLLFHFRTEDRVEEARNSFLDEVGERFPENATIHYLFALSYFKEAERKGDQELWKQSFSHASKAIELQKDFPEALWIRSRIYVVWRHLEPARQDLALLRVCAQNLNPRLFLYDRWLVTTIKEAADSWAR